MPSTPHVRTGRGLKRALAAASTAVVVSLAVVSTADANRYLSKAGAQSHARYAVGKEFYGIHYRSVRATCWPAVVPYRRGYRYRRWRCAWYHPPTGCNGRVRIRGARGAYRFFYRFVWTDC